MVKFKEHPGMPKKMEDELNESMRPIIEVLEGMKNGTYKIPKNKLDN